MNSTQTMGMELAEVKPEGRSVMDVAVSRAAQEVQAAMIVAKRFPRDETASEQRILTACRRKALAEQAQYAYRRGETLVSGPSIRLAEVLAQAWGNIDFGIIELEQKNGESNMMAYSWDLETNTRQTKIFTVRHERFTKKGTYSLNDPRDIYEMTANQGARRVRACILGIIPGDIIDKAVAECEKTLAGNNKEPLIDRVRKMVNLFSEHGVTAEMIERRLGHKLDATIEPELVQLGKIYLSLRDGMGKREDFFELPAAKENGSLADRLPDVDPETGEVKEAEGTTSCGESLFPDPISPEKCGMIEEIEARIGIDSDERKRRFGIGDLTALTDEGADEYYEKLLRLEKSGEKEKAKRGGKANGK